MGKKLLAAGLSFAAACGGNASQNEAPTVTDAVYFQPRLTDLHDPESLNVPEAAYVMLAEPEQPDSWTIGNCRPDNADNFTEPHPKARTLVGFSLGRNGLAYFLQVASPEERDAVESLVAVAPGNIHDFTDSCDPVNTGELIKIWLDEDPENTFTLFADGRTAEADYSGVKSLYLDAIAGTAVANQVLVCAVDMPGHEDSWNSVKNDIITAPQSEECPPGTTSYDTWRS